MYNKIFTKILDSSIWLESDTTRVVWITMIAAMDETGFCQFASVANLAHRARVNPEMAETAVATLEGPDPNSSDPDNEGRRIERVPGGWIVLNAEKYRAIVSRATGQEGTRRRVQAFRERKRSGVENRITEQEHKCACCFQPFDKPYNLYVVQDHNHDTLEQRGLICQSCNKCVGMVENGKPFVSKDPTIYVEYLKRYGNGSVMAVTELKRIGNGKVTQSETEAYSPDAGSELMAANHLLEELGVVGDNGVRRVAAEAIRLLAKEGGTVQTATEYILAAGKQARAAGEVITRFWFSDQRYRPEGAPKEKRARVPKIAAPPAPGQRSAEETAAYAMWESMSEEYRKANPWRAQ